MLCAVLLIAGVLPIQAAVAAPPTSSDRVVIDHERAEAEEAKRRNLQDQDARQAAKKPEPIVIAQPVDAWKVLPLRFQPTGPLSDEDAEKIKTWLKQNEQGFERPVLLTVTKTETVKTTGKPDTLKLSSNHEATFSQPTEINISAAIQNPKDLAKIQMARDNWGDNTTITVQAKVKKVTLVHDEKQSVLTLELENPDTVVAAKVASGN